MSRRDPDDLLAAYLDGVAELSVDERRTIEARLASEPALRTEADATRELLGALRELPREGVAPDWSALERSIRDAVPATAPTSWWRRHARWLVPVLGVATIVAIVASLDRSPAESPALATVTIDAGAPQPAEPEPLTPVANAVWLDGEPVELDDDALDALDALHALEIDDDVELDPDPIGALEAVDDAELAELERWLETQSRRRS